MSAAGPAAHRRYLSSPAAATLYGKIQDFLPKLKPMQFSCSHSNAICNPRFQNTLKLRTHKHSQSSLKPPLQCGKKKKQTDRNRTRRTQAVPFIAGPKPILSNIQSASWICTSCKIHQTPKIHVLFGPQIWGKSRCFACFHFPDPRPSQLTPPSWWDGVLGSPPIRDRPASDHLQVAIWARNNQIIRPMDIVDIWMINQL